MTLRRALAVGLVGLILAAGPLVLFHILARSPDGYASTLPKIGPAPDFTLTAQDGTAFSMADLRGKVVALNFVFTGCGDLCPLVTYKMLDIQEELSAQFGRDVFFVSITVDPEHDTPDVLAYYADALGCDTSGWAFLTGSPAATKDVARSYGVFYRQDSGEEIEHSLLTSLVDREGMLRVQYMGERFDPGELARDLRDLMAEDVS